MRLRPRASSSDLDEARAIARRLEQAAANVAEPRHEPQEGYVRFARGAQDADDTPPPGGSAGVESDAAHAPDARDEHEPRAAPEAEPEVDAAADAEFEPEPAQAEPMAADDPLEGLTDTPEQADDDAGDAGDDEPVDAGSVDAVVTFPPGEPSEGPTWDTLLLTSQALADAKAAMVVGSDGDVIAATGDWPKVGAQAVASKLLPLAARKLDAGGLVPVKMAGQVLTAWRLESSGQQLTVALLASSAVPEDLRPEVDQQLSQGRLD